MAEQIVSGRSTPWRRLTGLDRYDLEAPAITAASVPITNTKIKRGSISPEAWQQEAIELYSEVGELRYVANAQANAASRAELYVGRWEPGSEAPVRVEGIVEEAFDQFGGGALGRAELVKRLFLQLFVPGDGFIIGLPPGVMDDRGPMPPEFVTLNDLSWHVMAASEVKLANGQVTMNLGDRPIRVEESRAVVVRAWRPNPFRWWQADSPVRSNLPVLRELVGLTKHVSANIDSRLAGAGMLLLGDSFSLMAGQSPDPDDAPSADPILAALMDAMLTSIRDRDSASAVMPILLQGPDEAIDKVRHLTFGTPFDAATKDLRDEAIRRLALGLDTPPEVLLGMGESTHWNAWIIQDDTVRTHIDPALSLIADALTRDFLHPLLEQIGVPDFEEYSIWWDTSGLTQKADRSREAIELFDRGAITQEALRRETGFDEIDAPELPSIDQAAEIALRLVEAAPSLLSDPGLLAIVGQVRGVLEGEEASPVLEEDAPAEPDLPVEEAPDTFEDPEEPPAPEI